MKAFLLAAGFGERLKPITGLIPKPLVPVVNIPVICYSLALLKEAGISRVICNLHYRHEDVIDFFTKHEFFGMDITFSIEDTILGTGGGLKLCESYLLDGPFILINSDIITDIRLGSLIKEWGDANAGRSRIVLRPVRGENEKGTIAVKDGRVMDIKGFLRKGLPHDHDYTGVALLTPDIFERLPAEFSSIVDTAYRELAEQDMLDCCIHTGMWEDMGTLERYRRASLMAVKDKKFIARIKKHSGLGPKPVAEKVRIAPNADIRGSVIGENCAVEDGASVVNSVLLPGVRVKEGEVVRDTVKYGNNGQGN